MVSKCANPACSAPFHYLRDGKVFRLQVDQNGELGSEPKLVNGHRLHRVEHFWLCGACSQTMTLSVDKSKGVVAVPLKQPAIRAAAAS